MGTPAAEFCLRCFVLFSVSCFQAQCWAPLWLGPCRRVAGQNWTLPAPRCRPPWGRSAVLPGQPWAAMGPEMEPLFLAWSYFRRRKFQLCADLCTQMLEKSPYDQVPARPRQPCGSWGTRPRVPGVPKPRGGGSGEEGPESGGLCG